MKKLLALLAVLGLSTLASASPTVVSDVYDSGDTTEYNGVTYHRYVVALAVDEGGFSAVDFKITADAGSNLLQYTQYTCVKTTNSGTPKTYTYSPWTTKNTFYQQYDSQSGLIIPDTSVVVSDASVYARSGGNMMQEDTDSVAPANYTNPNTNGSLPVSRSSTGLGTSFRYSAGIASGTQEGALDTTSLTDFVQVWMADGMHATLTGSFCTADKAGVEVDFAPIGIPSIPEPMTLSVLALGALGLIRRKLA